MQITQLLPGDIIIATIHSKKSHSMRTLIDFVGKAIQEESGATTFVTTPDLDLSILRPATAPKEQPIEFDATPILRPGHHHPSGLWFFSDCIFSDEGMELSSREPFEDGNLIELKGKFYSIEYDPSTAPDMTTKSPPSAKSLDILLSELIHQYGLDGHLALGATLAYAFTPETLDQYNCAPGMWIHGKQASGKTVLANLLTSLWGMDHQQAISIRNSSPVSIDRLLNMYSSIPIVFDEFRADNAITGSLRACFNRQSKTKGRLDSTNRIRSVQPHTTPIIISECLCEDAATASRYLSINLSETKSYRHSQENFSKLAEAFKTCSFLIPHLFAGGRGERAEKFTQYLEEWMARPHETAASRQHLVYGIALAAFKTLPVSDDIKKNLERHILTRIHWENCTAAITDPSEPAVATLPPLGHDLTYPADSEHIKQLGIALNQVRSYCAEGTEEEIIQRLRQAAHRYGFNDLEAFHSFRTWIRLSEDATTACARVEASMQASNPQS